MFGEELCVEACDLGEVFEGFDGAVIGAVFDECFGFGWFEGEAGFDLFGGGGVDVDGLAEVAGEVADDGFDFFFGAFGSPGDHVIYGGGPELLRESDFHYALDGVAVGTHLDEGGFLFCFREIGVWEVFLGGEGEGEDCQ